VWCWTRSVRLVTYTDAATATCCGRDSEVLERAMELEVTGMNAHGKERDICGRLRKVSFTPSFLLLCGDQRLRGLPEVSDCGDYHAEALSSPSSRSGGTSPLAGLHGRMQASSLGGEAGPPVS